MPLASFKRNQFGADIAGPIRKNKDFFLFDYAGLRERSASSSTMTLPTLLERTGDYSQTFAANGQQIRIFDPFSTVPSGSGYVRTPFPGNVIPSSLIDPVGAKTLKYYPNPTSVGNPTTHASNYYQTGATALDVNQFDIREDHNFSETRRFFARYSKRNNISSPPKYFPTT